ncbi:guanine nucleotide binding protein, alpha subunit, partial [Infundibulicybe gibba]
LACFDSILRWSTNSSIVLLLTQTDSFKNMLQTIPLERHFPKYIGGTDVNKAVKYILWEFMQRNTARLSVYPHISQTVDATSHQLIFAAIRETMLQEALRSSRVLEK